MEQNHFTFIFGRKTENVQYKVTVYRPTPTEAIPHLNPNMQIPRHRFMTLVFRLQEGHLHVEPNPHHNLLTEGQDRIDTQQANNIYRNIQFQSGNRSYAVCTVARGGELCLGEYKSKLLRYIKQGLILSFDNRLMYNIRVTVQKKENPKYKKSIWVDQKDLTKEQAKSIGTNFDKNQKHRKEQIIAKRMTSAKNRHKISVGTDMIEHIVVAIERRIAETDEGEGAHAVSKKIPILSTVLGAFLAAGRASEGDWTGAFFKLTSGVADDVLEPGTGLSLAMDGVPLAKDIKEAIADERKHQQLAQADIDRLRKENADIREELATILPESPIYGSGCESYFDESELADLEDIIQIKIRASDLIDSIQFIYRSQSGKQHGGNGGNLSTFDLKPDERITTVSGTTSDGGCGISSLSFHTDYGREETFGKATGEDFQFEMTDGSYLGAIKGYDAYKDGKTGYPRRADYQLLPAIGFIAKM